MIAMNVVVTLLATNTSQKQIVEVPLEENIGT